MGRENELHNRLKTLRSERKLTQRQVAEYLGVDVSTYSHYEKGDRTPDINKLSALARLYKLDDEMLGARFPIESFVTYEQKDLEKLQQALINCEWREGDYKYNRWQYYQLKDAVTPILKSRSETFYIPQLDTSKLLPGDDVVKVKLDRRGEVLIDWYLRETHKFFEML